MKLKLQFMVIPYCDKFRAFKTPFLRDSTASVILNATNKNSEQKDIAYEVMNFNSR